MQRWQVAARLVWTGVWIGGGLACGDAAPPDPEEQEEPTGLRFERLAPLAEGEAAARGHYRARDGARLPVRHYPADSDTALLLVHGSGSHGRYLAPLARRIAEAGAARVYTPDLRGHGLEPARRGDCDYVDQLQDDLADLLEHARAERAGTRVVVGGHSSGGGLAVRFAGSAYREQASGYLLLAPFLGHDAPTTRVDAGGWARPRVPVIVGLSVLNALGITALNGVTAITFQMPDAVRDGTETLAYSYRLNTGYAPRDFRRDLAGLERPVLALIGADDEAFLPEQLAPALRPLVPATVEVLDGVGHLDLPAAAATAERVIRWLEALAPDV